MSRWIDGWVNHSQQGPLRIQGESSKPSTRFLGTCRLAGDIRPIEFPGARGLETWLLYACHGGQGGLPEDEGQPRRQAEFRRWGSSPHSGWR